MSAGNVLKNRKLGTRSFIRLALDSGDKDICHVIQRSLAEFLSIAEKMSLNTLLEDYNIFKQTSRVRFSPYWFLDTNRG